MKPVQLLLLLLAAGCARAPAQGNQMPPEQAPQPDPVTRPDVTQEALMDRIEGAVQMPPEASPLSAYSRSYAWHQDKDGTRTVRAVYERLTGARANQRRWVAETELPVIMDGGCGVVTLSYDVAAQRIESIGCNGYA